MSDALRPHGVQPARLLCPWNSPGKKTGVGCHSLLQGIFATQGLNLGLWHCRQILYRLSHQGIIIGSFLKNPRGLLIGTADSSSLGENSGEGNGIPLQYSCLENPTDEGAWWAAVHGVAKSWTQLSNFTFTFIFFQY